MTHSTKVFNLNVSIWQDISEGNETVAFRLPYRSPKNNVLRLKLDTALPDVDDTHFDRWEPPMNVDEETVFSFSGLSTTDRLYARADKANLNLAVHRK